MRISSGFSGWSVLYIFLSYWRNHHLYQFWYVNSWCDVSKNPGIFSPTSYGEFMLYKEPSIMVKIIIIIKEPVRTWMVFSGSWWGLLYKPKSTLCSPSWVMESQSLPVVLRMEETFPTKLLCFTIWILVGAWGSMLTCSRRQAFVQRSRHDTVALCWRDVTLGTNKEAF